MSFLSIRRAQQAVWPTVRESLERHRASRAALRDNPNPTASALHRARRPMERVSSEETVWALAKADFLNTPEQAAVIQAARAWAKYYGRCDLGELDDDERVLYDAVQALAVAPDDMPDEVLTDP